LYDTSRMIINEDLKIEDKTIYIKYNNEYKILSTMLSYDKVEYEGFYGEYKRLEDKKYFNDTLTIDEEKTLKNKQEMEYYEELFVKEKMFDELIKFNEIITNKNVFQLEFRNDYENIMKYKYDFKLTDITEIELQLKSEKDTSKIVKNEKIEELISSYYESGKSYLIEQYHRF
jgi:hypothetical protein